MSDEKKCNFLVDSRTGNITSLKNGIKTSQPISGGLWSLQNFPIFSFREIQIMSEMSYQSLAKTILGKFDFGISSEDLTKVINQAYGDQWYNKNITPVKQIGDINLYSLHLGYGPTFAFKNIALEFLPRLLSKLAPKKIFHVLGASSGDTINAAHSGVKGTNIRSMFMLPNIGPSEIQSLQAINGISDNPNALTFIADKSFDPLQDIVKKVNGPEYRDFKENYNIISFNSINIARILAQIVYYFRAYSKLIQNKSIKNGEKIIFSVPSGNFGDALAGYYALKMGLPIKKIHIATNENNMLEKFIETGIYEPPKKEGKDYVKVTNSPSMDIAKSSNFERMLFHITDGDYKKIAGWYDNLTKTGKFKVDSETLKKVQGIFTSSSSTDIERLSTIKKMSETYNHGIDPHTASGVFPWLGKDLQTPVIFLETSHVAQFGSELKAKGLIVPGMDEFNETFDEMKKNIPVEGKDYIKIGGDFDETMIQVEGVMKELFR